MDIFEPKKRSEIMSKVKSKNTSIELALFDIVRTLWTRYRYRKHCSGLPGTPDIAFTKQRVAVFADGEFWHGKDYSESKNKLPDYWHNKIERNMERDKKVNVALVNRGYVVLRFWGKEIKKKPEKVLKKISDALRQRDCSIS